MRHSIEGLVRPSKRMFASDVSNEVWIQFRIRHPAGESSQATPRNRIISWDVSSVQHCHETHARDTITMHCHEIRAWSTINSHAARSSQNYHATATNARQTRATLATECMIRNADKRVSVVALARFRCRFCTKSLLNLLLRLACKRFRDRCFTTV